MLSSSWASVIAVAAVHALAPLVAFLHRVSLYAGEDADTLWRYQWYNDIRIRSQNVPDLFLKLFLLLFAAAATAGAQLIFSFTPDDELTLGGVAYALVLTRAVLSAAWAITFFQYAAAPVSILFGLLSSLCVTAPSVITMYFAWKSDDARLAMCISAVLLIAVGILWDLGIATCYAAAQYYYMGHSREKDRELENSASQYATPPQQAFPPHPYGQQPQQPQQPMVDFSSYQPRSQHGMRYH